MATRSRLRMVLPSGKTKSIYCHHDGYPSNQMPLLKEYYNTTEKVEELMDLGSISYLAPIVKPSPGETHTFANPIEEVVVAYHRDRGDDWMGEHDCPEEYDYVFNGKTWKLHDGHGTY